MFRRKSNRKSPELLAMSPSQVTMSTFESTCGKKFFKKNRNGGNGLTGRRWFRASIPAKMCAMSQ